MTEQPASPVLPAGTSNLLSSARRHHEARQFAAALADYQAALQLAPDSEPVLAGLAALAMDVRDWHAAERILRKLEALYPGRHRTRLSLTLFNLGLHAEALPLLAELVEAGNTDLSCILAYAACLERTGDEDRALTILERVYGALPRAETATTLASAMLRLGRAELLDTRLPALITAHPDTAALLAAQSEHALARRDWARGFDLAGHRRAVALEPSALDSLPCQPWDGQRFDGCLLVTAEPGLGDEILTSSMFEDLARLGQACLVACDKRLLPVFSRSFPTLRFCDRQGDALAQAAKDSRNRKTGAFDLGRWFRRGDGDFPARRAWLQPDPARRDALRTQLEKRFPGRHPVGVAWRSARALVGDAKTLPLAALAPVLSRRDVAGINLQYGDTRADTDLFTKQTGLHLEQVPQVDNTDDIDGLFALVAALDAVVSSSNTTVHIAGALGVPVAAMIPGSRYSLWYWGYDGATTPWYPSVRLFRGPGRVPWETLAVEVSANLDTLWQHTPR